MKLKSNKQSLDEPKKYSIAFSPKNIEKWKVVYMYDRGDLILNEEPMSRSAVKLFEYLL